MISRKDLHKTVEGICKIHDLTSSITMGNTTHKIPFSVKFTCPHTGVHKTLYAKTVKELYYSLVSFDNGMQFTKKRNSFSPTPIKEDYYL